MDLNYEEVRKNKTGNTGGNKKTEWHNKAFLLRLMRDKVRQGRLLFPIKKAKRSQKIKNIMW